MKTTEKKQILEFPPGITETGTYIEFTFYKNVSEKNLVIDIPKKIKEYLENSAIIKNKTSDFVAQKKQELCSKEVKKKNVNPIDLADEILVPKYEVQGRVNLFFPDTQEIANEISLSWSEEDAGLIGQAITILKDRPKGEDILTTLEKKKDLLMGIGAKSILKSETAKSFTGGLSENVAAGYDQLSAYRGINPKVDSSFVKFDGIERRTPDFTFRFVPESAEQQKIIENIITIFQIYSYPDDQNPAGIEYPSMVKAKIYVVDRLLQTFNQCHIQTVTVNKNPEGFLFHEDGSPAVLDLTISLMEADRYYLRHFYRDELEKSGILIKESIDGDNFNKPENSVEI